MSNTEELITERQLIVEDVLNYVRMKRINVRKRRVICPTKIYPPTVFRAICFSLVGPYLNRDELFVFINRNRSVSFSIRKFPLRNSINYDPFSAADLTRMLIEVNEAAKHCEDPITASLINGRDPAPALLRFPATKKLKKSAVVIRKIEKKKSKVSNSDKKRIIESILENRRKAGWKPK